MKKKFIISLSSIILIYLAICLFFVFSYNSKLEKLNPVNGNIKYRVFRH